MKKLFWIFLICLFPFLLSSQILYGEYDIDIPAEMFGKIGFKADRNILFLDSNLSGNRVSYNYDYNAHSYFDSERDTLKVNLTNFIVGAVRINNKLDSGDYFETRVHKDYGDKVSSEIAIGVDYEYRTGQMAYNLVLMEIIWNGQVKRLVEIHDCDGKVFNETMPFWDFEWTSNDVWRIERIGNLIVFKRNGTIFYTSNCPVKTNTITSLVRCFDVAKAKNISEYQGLRIEKQRKQRQRFSNILKSKKVKNTSGCLVLSTF